MPKQISPTPKLRFFDDNGVPLVGGKLYTYAGGTTTPIVTYTDKDGGTANTNPIILDARGEADVWLDVATRYKFTLDDADDLNIWTVDGITAIDIYGENITWTGNHIFNGTVTLGSVLGAVTFDGAVIVDDTLYVTGNFTVDGTATFAGTIVCDALTTPLINLGAAGTIGDLLGWIALASANGATISVDNGAFTYTFREDGLLRLPVETPVDDLDAASKGYVDSEIAAAAPAGMVPVCIGAVVSNLLVTGSIGVTSVTHTGTGAYQIVPSAAFTSTGKTIVMCQIRDSGGGLNRNYSAFPEVNTTTQVTVRTGGGNSFAFSDQDFNFVIYSLP